MEVNDKMNKKQKTVEQISEQLLLQMQDDFSLSDRNIELLAQIANAMFVDELLQIEDEEKHYDISKEVCFASGYVDKFGAAQNPIEKWFEFLIHIKNKWASNN